MSKMAKNKPKNTVALKRSKKGLAARLAEGVYSISRDSGDDPAAISNFLL